MKDHIKIFIIILGVIAGTITLVFTFHNTYASKSEVESIRDDVKYNRATLDKIYGILINK